MGRIKSTMIKRTAKGIYSQAEGFTKDFEHNKRLLKDVLPFKSVRNKVAGMIIRLVEKDEE